MFKGIVIDTPRRRKQNVVLPLMVLFLTCLAFPFAIILRIEFIFDGSLTNFVVLESLNLIDTTPFYPETALTKKSFIIQGNKEKIDKYVNNVGGRKITAWVFMQLSSLSRTNITYYVLQNVYVNPAGGWSDGRSIIQYPQMVGVPRFNTKSGPVTQRVDDLICLGNEWCYVFAHFVLDVLSYLVYIPLEVRKSSYFLILSTSSVYREFLTQLDIEDSKILCPGRSFIFASRFHTIISSESIHGCFVEGLPKVSETIRKKFKCENVKPEFLGFYNRPKNRNRHILEFPELVKACQKHFEGNIDVRELAEYKSLEEAVKQYSPIKIFFSPTGSSIINCMFMAENTGIVCCLGDLNDPPAECAAKVLHKWMITVAVPGMKHHAADKGSLPHESAIKSIEAVMYAIEHQEWQNNL